MCDSRLQKTGQQILQFEFFTKRYWRDQIKEDDVGGSSGIGYMGHDRSSYIILRIKSDGKNCLRDMWNFSE
jgi:hypothetical protein